MEALINDQQLFKARREYEQKEAAAKAAEAAERCTTQCRRVGIWIRELWQPSSVQLLLHVGHVLHTTAACALQACKSAGGGHST